MIRKNVLELKKEIPPRVQILAATKTRSVDEIKEAIDAGIRLIGENYLQEAEKKSSVKLYAKMHLIGHLQKNKIKKAVEIFDMIETVDSIATAKEIDKRSKEIGKIMPILIEVNIASEKTKSGCNKSDLIDLAEACLDMKNIELKGMMAMPYSQDEKILRQYFKEAKVLFEKMKLLDKKIDTLSLGMSDSYKIAVEEGANLVRIGTRIFGERKKLINKN